MEEILHHLLDVKKPVNDGINYPTSTGESTGLLVAIKSSGVL